MGSKQCPWTRVIQRITEYIAFIRMMDIFSLSLSYIKTVLFVVDEVHTVFMQPKIEKETMKENSFFCRLLSNRPPRIFCVLNEWEHYVLMLCQLGPSVFTKLFANYVYWHFFSVSIVLSVSRRDVHRVFVGN